MARIYATPTDLAASPWDLSLPAGEALSVLHRATIAIEGLTTSAIYRVDEESMPLDLEVSEAFRDAICAQAVWFSETGDVSGAGSRFNSVSLGSFSISGGGTGSGTNTSVAASRYAPEALSILQTAGLLGGSPRS